MSIKKNKCLIVGPSWVGDMIMAQSLFMAIKQQYPDISIDVLAPAWSEPLLSSMPEVQHSIVMPVGHGEVGLGKRFQLGKSLRDKRYDWAIVLPNSLKSALVPFWAKIPLRTGYKGEMRYGLLNDIRHLDKSILTMTVQRFVALGVDSNSQLPPQFESPRLALDQHRVKEIKQKFDLENSAPIIAFCPGAEYGEAKRWPENYFSQLADRLVGFKPTILLLGSKKDQQVSGVIKTSKSMVEILDLAGRTSLEEAVALLSLSDVVVSNDSGLMHVAAAVGTPVIALYGSSDPTFTPPLAKNTQVLNLGLACSPCFKRECPLGTLACLKGIEVEQVFEAMKKYLS